MRRNISLVDSFTQLLAVHETLDQLFDRHMEALLLLELSRASYLLHRYETELVAHIEAEERVILPVYGARTGAIPGGSVEIFKAEHQKIRSMLAGFTESIKTLEAQPRDVLGLLDKEFTFKHLMDHHDRREANLLYLSMDRITSEEERRDLLRRMERPAPYGVQPDGHRKSNTDRGCSSGVEF